MIVLMNFSISEQGTDPNVFAPLGLISCVDYHESCLVSETFVPNFALSARNNGATHLRCLLPLTTVDGRMLHSIRDECHTKAHPLVVKRRSVTLR